MTHRYVSLDTQKGKNAFWDSVDQWDQLDVYAPCSSQPVKVELRLSVLLFAG